MVERLQYLFIGAVIGAVLGLFLWFVLGSGLGVHSLNRQGSLNVRSWVIPTSAVCALIGFVFKVDLGTAVGDAVAFLIQVISGISSGGPSSSSPQVPTWLAALVLLLVLVAAVFLAA